MLSVIAHYQEIALKGKNRPWFLQRLIRNLRVVLSDLDLRAVRTPMGRLEIVLGRESDWPEASDRLSRVFGLANFSLARHAPLDVEGIAAAVVQHLPAETVPSFRVSVRRADKSFPVLSPEVERVIGRRVQDARGWPVDLSHPALVIGVEIVPERAFYHYGKVPGPGGLPVGTAGKVAVLLSGGIDSPVAAWRLMKRGCHATLVHFHGYPFEDAFGELQRQITLSVPGPLRVVIYRRLMLRIAERIAQSVGAQALVTGEVVGQVASQTLENISVIGAAASLPILRPLVGMDKEEITAEAQRLSTYAISIVPDEDCCTLFTPRHPATRAKRAQIEDAEQSLTLEEMVEHAVRDAVVEEFSYPIAMVKSPTVPSLTTER